MCQKHPELTDKSRLRGSPRMPVEAMLMASLNILGHGHSYFIAGAMAHVSTAKVCVWHKAFLHHVLDELYDEYIRWPKGEELRYVCGVFELHGFPGCMASMDGVHRPWGKCPWTLSPLCRGKEGVPTLVWNVSVDHAKYILNIEGSHPGARNDKTIVRFDDFVNEVCHGEYSQVAFELFNSAGETTTHTGLYVLCDGGYHKWRACQSPLPTQKVWGQRFNSRLESTRKDSEMTFGVLKNRFRILRVASEYHIKGDVDAEFKVCCILHNMLLIDDGLSDMGRKKQHWDVTNKTSTPSHVGLHSADTNRNNFPMDGVHVFGAAEQPSNETDTDEHSTFWDLRTQLLADFKFRWNNGLIKWMKTAKACVLQKTPEELYALEEECSHTVGEEWQDATTFSILPEVCYLQNVPPAPAARYPRDPHVDLEEEDEDHVEYGEVEDPEVEGDDEEDI